MTQRTLSIVKPDAFAKGSIGGILAMIEKSGLKIVATKSLRLTQSQAEGFYAVHRERPFFRDLVSFMTSGPVVVSVLEGDNAVQRYRDLMGPTNSKNAPKGTIRGEFGTDIERNAVHGSDSAENAVIEVNYFFSASEIRALE